MQMTERTWKNTEWPELTLASTENDDARQVDVVALGKVFDTICLVEIEFPHEHAKQVARFCDVLQRACRGVPTNDRARMTLYDRARRNLAIFAGRQVTGGYLWTRRQLKKKLAKKGVDISSNYDDFYPMLKAELSKPFFIIPGAAQVNPANVCMFNE